MAEQQVSKKTQEEARKLAELRMRRAREENRKRERESTRALYASYVNSR